MAVHEAPAQTLGRPAAATVPVFRLSAPSPVVVSLSALIAVLAAFVTVVGLFSQGGPGEFPFKTVRGETVQMFGQGIYRYDTLFQGAINRGTDIVTLLLGVPLLVTFSVLYRRGSLRGRLLLSGILASFVYVYANMALSAAYNTLYLAYVALFSASVYALVLTLGSIDPEALGARLSATVPWRMTARFMFVAGAVPALLWLSDVVGQLLQGEVPKHLDSYTTNVTYSLDLAIITPACVVAGMLLLRHAAHGYLMAFPLLGIVVMLVPEIIVGTVSQLAAGVTLSPGEIVGPVVGFLLLGIVALGILVSLVRNVAEWTG